MEVRQSRYFWTLDNDLPLQLLQKYHSVASDQPDSTLAQMLGMLQKQIPVPPMAYLTSAFYEHAAKRAPQDFLQDLADVVGRIEKLTQTRLGGSQYPLLLTVQGDFCGAIRNIGVDVSNLPALVHQLGNASAYTLYVDFLESFSSLVLAVPHVDFRRMFHIEATRDGSSAGLADLHESDFLTKVKEYQLHIAQKSGRPFPTKPEIQLVLTLQHCARVAQSSGGDEIFVRTQLHRGIGGKSVKGAVYTRNPFNGKQDVYGVYEFGLDGKKAALETDDAAEKGDCLRDKHPEIYAAIRKQLGHVEDCFREVMEVEFVSSENGQLYFTNFDKAQKTSKATLVSAVELNTNGAISDLEAALRIKPADVEVLMHPTLTDQSRSQLEDLGSVGVTAAPGTAIGKVFFKMSEAIEFYNNAKKNKQDHRMILVTDELTIADSSGLGMVTGLVTKASGIASHAAVMARANGIPCIVGYKGLEVDPGSNSMLVNGKRYPAGTLMTMEAGSEGKIYLGKGELQNPSFQEGIIKSVTKLIGRVVKSENIPLSIYTNINNAKDAQNGLNFGADGVGLCRTENMFIRPEAMWEIRNIIFTQNPKETRQSFEKLEEQQFLDYRDIFKVMQERNTNIRLMDMPLAELVPQSETEFKELFQKLKHLDETFIRGVAEGLKEHNPMLGLRACRFGMIMPEIYQMQIRAIVRAAYEVAKDGGKVNPGIMFPLVFTKTELTTMKKLVVEIEEQIRNDLRVPVSRKIKFRVGTMLELPAAALEADKLAEASEFFAFGTNDLTQTTLGISRDDSAHFLPVYMEKEIIKGDPFRELFPPVRELIDIAVSRGRRVRPDARFGICGEQGADESTIIFCLEKNLNYVSCSPFRVLPAKVALVQTGIQMKTLLNHQLELEMEERAQGQNSAPAKPAARDALPGASGRLPPASFVGRR